MSPTPLPVDALLPDLRAALAVSPCVVVEAAPGAGKTTRIPWFIAEHILGSRAQVVVTEPRRIAARLAAHFVASELGEEVGKRVGYSVRFEERVSRETRVRYATEGVLLRQLLSTPTLPDVQCVVLDEFHERHIATDQLLALCTHLQKKRSDLKLVVMSATLDAEPLAAFLGNCPRLRSEGKSYPLRIEYSEPDERPLEKQVLSALRRAFTEVPTGNVLVFLPGYGEIRRCQEALGQSPLRAECDTVVLHGEQPIKEQAQAVERGTRRRVILSTNVAESSVTVDGVQCVIDSGLSRVASHSAWTSVSTLKLERISQSSAIQRAGRAARQAPGVVYRLYSETDFVARKVQQAPEVQRSDLSSLVLECLGTGVPVTDLAWYSPLPQAALEQAHALLKTLGALTANGQLSQLGKRLLEVPLPPRLARVLLEGEHRGVGDDAALAVALLAERDIQSTRDARTDLPTSSSDLQDRVDRYKEAEGNRFTHHTLHQLALDAGRVREVKTLFERLRRWVKATDLSLHPEEIEERVRRSLLAGFSDRVARRKSPGHADLILATGSTARLAAESVVRTEPFVVVLDIEERASEGRRSGPVVRWASGISADWLLEDFSEGIQCTDDCVYSGERQRVELVSRMAFGSVTLDETRKAAPPSDAASELLYQHAQGRLTALLGKASGTDSLRQRLSLLCEYGAVKQTAASDSANAWDDLALLRRACSGITAFADLESVNFEQQILSDLSDELRRALLRDCPEHYKLTGGRQLEIHYEPGKPPWIASRLQDFFGLKQSPCILGGRLMLTVHLLAPNQRAVQVTSDLAGFWTRHYPEIRKELMRRYPRHAWPEDGANATPSAPLPRRRPA